VTDSVSGAILDVEACCNQRLRKRIVVIIATDEQHVSVFAVLELGEPNFFSPRLTKTMLNTFGFGDVFKCRFTPILFNFS
jgi:hypothetical protein